MNTPQPSAALATYDRAGLLIVVLASLGILLFVFGCDKDKGDRQPIAPSTPQQISTAQTAVAQVKQDVAAAKKAASSVATAHTTLTAAKATVAALPTPATTQKAEAQAQIDGADAELVSADSALGITLTSADTHTDQALTALAGAQQSAQADQKREAKKDKELTAVKKENKDLKTADPAKATLELVGVLAIIAGIALALLAFFAESIPVVGKWVTKLGEFAYELAGLLFIGGIALLATARWLHTLEDAFIWTSVALAVAVAAILVRRYWPQISNFTFTGRTTTTATSTPSNTAAGVPTFPASGK